MSLDRAHLDRVFSQWTDQMLATGAAPVVCLGVVPGPPEQVSFCVVAGYDLPRLLELFRVAARAIEAGTIADTLAPSTSLRIVGEGG